MFIPTAQTMLNELVTAHGCTPSNIAKQAGISAKTVQRILDGRAHPSSKTEVNVLRLYWFCLYNKEPKSRGVEMVTKQSNEVQKVEANSNLFIKAPNILLIEGQSITQEMHTKFLESLGCHVVTVTSAKEIPEKCAANFDLILVDAVLPDINGLALSAAIRVKAPTYIPIVALTKQDGLRKSDCDWLTLDEVISKPASIFKLKEILQRLLPTLLKQDVLN